MIEFFIIVVMCFFAIPFAWIIGKFTVGNFSNGMFSFFASTLLALFIFPICIISGVSAYGEAGIYSLPIWVFTAFIFYMYVMKVGECFSGFGGAIAPLLKPFALIISMFGGLFKSSKMKDSLDKLDNF